MSAAAPAGNLFDKHGSRNPAVRALMRGFDGALGELADLAAPDSILDVGCGEGDVTERLARRTDAAPVVGVDVEDPGLRAAWSRRNGGVRFEVVAATGPLPFAVDEFDLVCAIESLEHMADPAARLAEMARCARGHLLVSVPREPLWRALNVMRGAHLRRLGDTPGHRGHWSRAGLVALLETVGRVRAVRTPAPWTMALVEVSPPRYS